MIKVIMHGCNGHMGQVISGIIESDIEVTIVAGIDISDSGKNTYPVFSDLYECNVDADVIIDFSSAKAVDDLLDYSISKKIPVVLCTTGLTKDQLAKIEESAKSVAILRSANMSLGINTVMELLKVATSVLSDADYDIEIVEQHHNQKMDAPSGTALALADVINKELNNEYVYKYDRSQQRVKREKKEIGISALRGGTIVGIHDVIYAGLDEVIEIRHTAYSKDVFAKGAIQAAKFMAGREPGLYTMQDLFN